MSPKAAKKLRTPQQLKKAKRAAAMNRQTKSWWEQRLAQVLGQVPADESGRARHLNDITSQLQACLEQVRDHLQGEQVPLSAIQLMTVRTTDFPSAWARASSLGSWLRSVGATPCVSFVIVDFLQTEGALVEVEVEAVHFTQVAGPPLPESPPEELVPEHLRAALRAELDALVHGDRPDDLYWVNEDGATLVEQPEEIWEHPLTTWFPDAAGGWTVVLPLWTVMDCPSELSAEIYLDPARKVGVSASGSCSCRPRVTGERVCLGGAAKVASTPCPCSRNPPRRYGRAVGDVVAGVDLPRARLEKTRLIDAHKTKHGRPPREDGTRW